MKLCTLKKVEKPGVAPDGAVFAESSWVWCESQTEDALAPVEFDCLDIGQFVLCEVTLEELPEVQRMQQEIELLRKQNQAMLFDIAESHFSEDVEEVGCRCEWCKLFDEMEELQEAKDA
jgi:hypothetical protein